MKVRSFEYQNKDTPLLKKDAIFRILFALLFFIVFVWQIIFIFRDYSLHTLTTLKAAVGTIVLIVSILFDLVAFAYAYRAVDTLSKIKLHGHAVRMVTIFSDNKKGSFVRMYDKLTKLIALVMGLALVSGLTYAILEYFYYSSISFYLPILFFIAVSGFNTVYHVTTEIKVMKEVQSYNNIY